MVCFFPVGTSLWSSRQLSSVTFFVVNFLLGSWVTLPPKLQLPEADGADGFKLHGNAKVGRGLTPGFVGDNLIRPLRRNLYQMGIYTSTIGVMAIMGV